MAPATSKITPKKKGRKKERVEESVKLTERVGMRFRMPRSQHAPIVFNLPDQGQESPEERELRQALKGHIGGHLAMESEGLCSAAGLVEDFDALGNFRLFDAYTEGRLGTAPGIENFKYTVARFAWGFGEDLPAPFAGAGEDFEQLVERSLWVVQIYENPSGLSINFSHRQPLYLPNGDPVVEWPKGAPRDERGKRIGSPLPLKPAFDLRVVDGAVQLVPVQ